MPCLRRLGIGGGLKTFRQLALVVRCNRVFHGGVAQSGAEELPDGMSIVHVLPAGISKTRPVIHRNNPF